MASSASKILRKLSREEAFYFFISIGNYIGESSVPKRAREENRGS
jgi:hypothetical protein